MVYAQLERLKKDSTELDMYAKKLQKKGQIEQAKKIMMKRDYVINTLRELQPNPT